jgi:hypothetical protein
MADLAWLVPDNTCYAAYSRFDIRRRSTSAKATPSARFVFVKAQIRHSAGKAAECGANKEDHVGESAVCKVKAIFLALKK